MHLVCSSNVQVAHRELYPSHLKTVMDTIHETAGFKKKNSHLNISCKDFIITVFYPKHDTIVIVGYGVNL